MMMSLSEVVGTLPNSPKNMSPHPPTIQTHDQNSDGRDSDVKDVATDLAPLAFAGLVPVGATTGCYLASRPRRSSLSPRIAGVIRGEWQRCL
ncbi:hypothetical protein RMSM_03135 [Rhodopirellula maiorica SM1]|uniref:Uncharacterized protein n=1 Tax=Rhodopirellula maiorica SM1 TaxID=1265738 RepID=M5RKU4_9BACT|nr:hypothetical protein RMSM_03135 [Rhodopirellula maiorica SM1]